MAPRSLSILFMFLDPTVLETGSSDQHSGGSQAAPDPSSIQSSPPCPRSSLSRLLHRSSQPSPFMASPAHASAPTETPSPLRERSESPEDPATPQSRPPSPPVPLRVKQHSLSARVPTRGSTHTAGYDLHSAEAKTVPARGRSLVNTNLSVVVPPGTYGRIAPRSGLATKFGLDTGAGVVDSDYHSLVYILLINHSDQDFQVNVSDRIAQLILERIATPLVAEDPELDGAISTPSASFTLDPLLDSRDPCPETRAPAKKNCQRIRSPDARSSVPISSHPRFVSPVPRPPGIPPPPSASTSTGRR